jgi:hypothetical protein
VPSLKWSPSGQRSAGKPTAGSLLRNDPGLGNMCSSNVLTSPAARFTLDALSFFPFCSNLHAGPQSESAHGTLPSRTFFSNIHVVNIISLGVVFCTEAISSCMPGCTAPMTSKGVAQPHSCCRSGALSRDSPLEKQSLRPCA